MLKELIAQIFCREIGRKLRRLGLLGAIAGAYFALHVELPLEISIATKEAQVMLVKVQQTAKEGVVQWERREDKMRLLHPTEIRNITRFKE
jgi:hypothetical protein